MNNRRRRSSERGFALLVVIILLAIMTAATALAMDSALASMRSHAGDRAAEIIRSAMDYGVSEAIAQVQQDDVEYIINPTIHPNLVVGARDFDIFSKDRNQFASPYIPPLQYPPTGLFQNDYNVLIGLRRSQIARAPAGEDVRSAYGQVLEVQIQVQAAAVGVPPAEERVTLGILIPRRVANAK